jgi:hypothetical protein
LPVFPRTQGYPIDRGFTSVILANIDSASKQNEGGEIGEKLGISFWGVYYMLKGLRKRLFGAGPFAHSSRGFFLNVRCKACGEVFNLFIDKSTDLAQNFDERGSVTYFLNKEIIGSRCRNLIYVKMEFNEHKNLVSREIENGEFIE